jgi:hypothetical protein
MSFSYRQIYKHIHRKIINVQEPETGRYIEGCNLEVASIRRKVVESNRHLHLLSNFCVSGTVLYLSIISINFAPNDAAALFCHFIVKCRFGEMTPLA